MRGLTTSNPVKEAFPTYDQTPMVLGEIQMSPLVSEFGKVAVDAAVIFGWWFAISVFVAVCWSLFHMRLNRRRGHAVHAPQSAQLRLVVPKPTPAPDNDHTPSRPAA